MSCGAARLVVGLGHPQRGDDAVGPLVAARVQELRLPGTHVVTSASPLDLLELWHGHDDVVVVDAVRRDRAAGTVSVTSAAAGPLPVPPQTAGTHGLGLSEAVELARVLGRLPRRLVVVGIEPDDLRAGAALSPAASLALDAAAEVVADILQRTLVPGSEDGRSW